MSGSFYLCGVEYIHYFAEGGVVVAVVLLADELDVPQLAKVEVPLLLQAVYGHLQVQQLPWPTGSRTADGTPGTKQQGMQQKITKRFEDGC